MKKYIVITKHDKGICTLLVNATDEKEARQLVMKAEGCPDHAIINIRPVNTTKKYDRWKF